MSHKRRYIEQVLGQILASQADRERLAADLGAHFREGLEAGESEAAVVARLGSADEVAHAYMAGVELRYAGFWERLVAFAADVGMCLTLVSPLVAMGWLLAPFVESSTDSAVGAIATGVAVALGLGMLGLFLCYFPLLEGRFGRTVGKALLGLRVRSETGGEVGLSAAFIRRLSFYFNILVVDALFLLFTTKKQRAFDIVAKTVVVHDPDLARGARRYALCLLPWLVPAVAAAIAVLVTSK